VRGPSGPRWYWRLTRREDAEERTLRTGWWTPAEAEEQVRDEVGATVAERPNAVHGGAGARSERDATRATPRRARGPEVDA
jgi:hypothetical protein